MFYRKDLILLLLILLWNAYIFFGLERMSENVDKLIVNFTISTGILAVILVILMILMTNIRKFREWMCTPLFKKKEK
jgi:hypothetical protein